LATVHFNVSALVRAVVCALATVHFDFSAVVCAVAMVISGCWTLDMMRCHARAGLGGGTIRQARDCCYPGEDEEDCEDRLPHFSAGKHLLCDLQSDKKLNEAGCPLRKSGTKNRSFIRIFSNQKKQTKR